MKLSNGVRVKAWQTFLMGLFTFWIPYVTLAQLTIQGPDSIEDFGTVEASSIPADAVKKPKITQITFDPPKAWPLNHPLARSTASAITSPVGRMVSWSIVGENYGATIESSTGVIRPAEGKSGVITVRATDVSDPSIFLDSSFTIQAVPTGLLSSYVSKPSSSRFYLGKWIHTFTSSGGSLEGIYISETIRTLTKPSPFRGLGNLAHDPPANPLGSIYPHEGSSWILDANGTMKAADQYGIAKIAIDARAFLSDSSKGDLPQTHRILQWYSWYFAPGKRWMPFMGPNEITWTLRFNASQDDLEVEIKAYGQEVVHRYEGPAWIVEKIRFAPSTPSGDPSKANPY